MLFNIGSRLMEAYQNFKFSTSDASCEALSPLASEVFANACPRLFDGFFVTLELLFLSSVIGFVLAVGLVLARRSSIRMFAAVTHAYVYALRGTPLLIQLWLVYFGIGGLGADALGAWWFIFQNAWLVGLIVLTLNTSAYVSEILLGGLNNLPKGQYEAAIAQGMTKAQTVRRILLPQAIRIAWPAYGNELVLLMKGSALVSTITVMDLMGQTRTLFSRSYDVSIYLYAALLYLILTGFITLCVKLMERHLMRAQLQV